MDFNEKVLRLALEQATSKPRCEFALLYAAYDMDEARRFLNSPGFEDMFFEHRVRKVVRQALFDLGLIHLKGPMN